MRKKDSLFPISLFPTFKQIYTIYDTKVANMAHKIFQKKLLKPVSGFTLLEAIIALTLTSLLTLLVFAGIRFYHNLFVKIQRTGEVQTAINQLQTVLRNDTEKSKELFFDEFLYCSNEDGTINYMFLENAIVRNSDISSDTFRINYRQPEFVYSERLENMITGITIPCYNEELVFMVSVIKKYPCGLEFKNIDNE